MTLRHMALVAFGIVFMAALAPAARAADFAAFGGGSASTEISFSLPDAPMPDFFAADGSYFRMADVTYQQGGFSPCPCQGDFTFYIVAGAFTGGVDTPAGYFSGPLLFSGPVSHPTFLAGEYGITFLNDASFYNGASGELAATGVPEPATWAMMLFGVYLSGLALRSRRSIQRA
jgi:hypothetical protein